MTVKVIDKNDNSPKFRQESYLFDVKRTATEGYKLGQVKKPKTLNTYVVFSDTVKQCLNNSVVKSDCPREKTSIGIERDKVGTNI